MKTERWLPIPGYEGYDASDLGRVRTRKLRPGIKAEQSTKSCHRTVGLVHPLTKKVETRLVHQLVLETFVGPCPPGLEALHKDGVHANNRLSNLRYGTHAENMNDRERHCRTARGEVHGKAKLTDAEARAIALSPASKRSLARVYGVSRTSVQRIKKGLRKEAFRAVG